MKQHGKYRETTTSFTKFPSASSGWYQSRHNRRQRIQRTTQMYFIR